MARLTHWKPPAFSPEEPDVTLDMTLQIPEAGHATQLLNMGDDDFLDGMDDTFGSPQRSPQQHALEQPPLTLEELTPRKALKSNLRDALSTRVYAESTPFLKRDKFSPVRRTRACQDEENVQPHDVTHGVADAGPASQRSKPTSPKRPSRASARPQAQIPISEDDTASLRPHKEIVVKPTLPDAPEPSIEPTKIMQQAPKPAVTIAPQKAVRPEMQPGPLSTLSAPHIRPETTRARQHARNPSSLSNETVKAQKTAPSHTMRSSKTVTDPAVAVQRAPARGQPKIARPIGSADETAKPLQSENKRSEPVASKDTATDTNTCRGTATAAPNTDILKSSDSPSRSRPSTPPRDRRASSPLTLSKLSPSKQSPDAVLDPQPALTTVGAERTPSPTPATTPHPAKPVLPAQPRTGKIFKQPPGWALSDVPPSELPSAASAPTAGPSKAKVNPVTKVLAGKPQNKKQAARRRSSVQRNYCVPSVATKQKSVPRPGALTAKRRAGLQDQDHAGTSSRRRDPGLASSGEGKKPNQRLTKPIEFHFKVESRLSARKASDEQDASGTVAVPRDPSIPDFAARHALEAERVLARKERIAPTVPQSPEFTVEARLREREKFEEGRRSREAEIQQQKEQERLDREKEEEVELRRLRKLAVPKANAVPEWYAHAPKKSSRSASSSTSGTT